MYFEASDKIAADYPELESAITALDEHLAHSGGSFIRTESASDFVNEDPPVVERLLRAYVRSGALMVEEEQACPVCEQSLTLRRDRDELWCDLCDRAYPPTVAKTPVYRVSAEAAMSTHIAGSEGRESSKVGPHRILFIAGDRGGGPRAQLDQPGEEKALRRALTSPSFSFGAAVYAAGPGDLIGHIADGPSIVHIVGHGNDRRLVLVTPGQPLATYPIQADHVQSLLSHAPQRILLMYFNTCESTGIARQLAQAGVVDAAIGIPGKINDNAAVEFATSFYTLIAQGRSLAQAMDMSAVCLGELSRQDGPQLFTAKGIDPSTYVLVQASQ